MKQILTSLFVLISVALSAQNFTFECICNAKMTGDSCDICPGTSISSRSFTGLLIYRNGVEYKWIDEPYMVRLRPDENVEFLEQGPNPDKVTIALYQTPFYTIGGFLDSTFCQCNDAIKPLWYATDSTNLGPIFRGDTLMITGWGGTTVTFDSVLQKYVIYSATGGGTYTAGTGIDITGTVISNTGDLSNTNELQTIANTSDGTSHTATLSNSGGSVKIVEGTGIGLATTGTTLDGIVTVTNTQPLGTGTENYFPKWGTGGTVLTGTSNVFGIGKFLGVNNTSPASIINPVVPADTHGIRINYSYFTGTSRRPLSVINQDALETFAIGGSRTSNEGNIFLSAPSVQGSGSGITFTSNVGVTNRTGLFQLDNSGNLVFRHSTSGSSMYFDFMSSAIFRDNGFTTRFLVNSTEAACTNNFKLGTYSGSAATSITGRDASNFLTSVTIGSGLSLSGGTLSASAGSAWLLDGNTVSSIKTIGTNDNFDLPFETNGTIRGRFSTTGDFLINSTTTGNKLNVEGLGSSGVGARFNGGTFSSGNTGVQIGGNATTTVYGLDVNMTVTGASNNMINRFRNGSTGNTLNQISVSSTGGDPMQQFQTEGASGHIWVTGIDNSLADKFRIEPNPAIGDDELGLHIEKTSEFGFGKAASTSHSGVWGLTKPLGLPAGASSSRAFGTNPAIWYNSTVSRTEIFCASHNIYKGITSNGTPTISNVYSNAGVGATVTLSTGSNDIAGQITFTTGSTGLLSGQQFELQFAGAYSGQVFVFLQSRSATFSAQNTNFFVGTQGTGSFKVDVATALTPGTAYIFNYKVEQ